jgi:hypothetical protein
MATKHIPIRTCIATGVKKAKNEMIRIVRKPDGDVVIDVKGKEKGRGANLVMDVNIFDLAIKKRVLNRALKLDNPLSKEKIGLLRQEFIEAIELKQFRKGNRPVTIKVDKEDLE